MKGVFLQCVIIFFSLISRVTGSISKLAGSSFAAVQANTLNDSSTTLYSQWSWYHHCPLAVILIQPEKEINWFDQIRQGALSGYGCSSSKTRFNSSALELEHGFIFISWINLAMNQSSKNTILGERNRNFAEKFDSLLTSKFLLIAFSPIVLVFWILWEFGTLKCPKPNFLRFGTSISEIRWR